MNCTLILYAGQFNSIANVFCTWDIMKNRLDVYVCVLCICYSCNFYFLTYSYTLSEAWSGVNWADLIAAQGGFGADFYDRSITPFKASCLLSFW